MNWQLSLQGGWKKPEKIHPILGLFRGRCFYEAQNELNDPLPLPSDKTRFLKGRDAGLRSAPTPIRCWSYCFKLHSLSMDTTLCLFRFNRSSTGRQGCIYLRWLFGLREPCTSTGVFSCRLYTHRAAVTGEHLEIKWNSPKSLDACRQFFSIFPANVHACATSILQYCWHSWYL